MARRVDPSSRPGLADYEAVGHLSGAVRELRTHGEWVARRMRGRTVWMVNSTARGGGVAEMLPSEVALLRELGIATEWVVLESDEPDFENPATGAARWRWREGDPELWMFCRTGSDAVVG